MEEWVKVYGDYKKKELRNMCWITSKKENSKGLIAKNRHSYTQSIRQEWYYAYYGFSYTI